jgi:UDP-N-acetylglucosamine enolpyruvyl transferase
MPSPEIDALIAEVAADDSVFDSAVAFINGVPALIQAAVDKATAAGATPAQLAAVTGVATDLKAKAAAIQAAIAANTPTPTPAAASSGT